MRLLAAGVVVSLTLGACGGRQDAGTAIPDWTLEPVPLLAVGDVADTDSAVFSRVTDARLLETGMLAVADGGARSVLFFDATGQQRARLGRRGRGPGEFTGGMSLAGLGADSLAVWDPGQPRWTLIAGESPTLSTEASVTPNAAWIHAGVLVRGERTLVPDWAPPLLLTLADSLPEIRFGFVDETALLWVNTDAAGREWRAYAGPEAVGHITLPAELRPTQFRADRVVGVLSDSLGLEQVVVHRFARPAGITPGLGAATPPTPDPQARGDLISAMRTAVVAQEMHYAQAMSYTQRTDSLAVTMPPGARFRILDADSRGWRGVGWYTATGYSCGMIVGGVPPRGWREGEARCGW
jgi:hypothetical protein